MDTLNLLCRANGAMIYYTTFVIHKGQAPTGMEVSLAGDFAITGGGTLVYSDLTGPEAGFENIIITTPGGSPGVVMVAKYWFRQINVGILMQSDAGTYHCSVMHMTGGTIPGSFMSSGGLTIVVNTKPGQARSHRAHSNQILTYSAALLGASKLIF